MPRKTDGIAFGFLMLAVVALGLFQVLAVSYSWVGPGGEDEWEAYRGCQVWVDLVGVLKHPMHLDVIDWVVHAALVAGVLLVIGSPFLIGVLSGSRVMWWMAVVSSGVAMCGLLGCLIYLIAGNPPDEHWRYGPGMGALLAYPVLNFIGLLWVRRRVDEAGVFH